MRAYHVEQSAKPGDEAAIALLSEAAAAATNTAPATAARWYAAAERLLPAGEPLRRAMLVAPMALALASAGRLQESREALVRVLELLPPEPTPPRLAIVAACAAVEGVLGRHGDARRRLLEALKDAPADGRAGLALEMAVGAFWRGHAADMREWAGRAEDAAGDDRVLKASAAALGALGVLWEGDGAAAFATLDRSAALLRDVDDDALAARLDCARHVGIMELHAERFADAAATATRGAEIARRTGQGHALVPFLIVHAMAGVNLLQLDTALREGEEAEDGARLQGVPHLLQYALWERALVHHFRGERFEARRAAAEFTELLPTARAEQPHPHRQLQHRADPGRRRPGALHRRDAGGGGRPDRGRQPHLGHLAPARDDPGEHRDRADRRGRGLGGAGGAPRRRVGPPGRSGARGLCAGRGAARS